MKLSSSQVTVLEAYFGLLWCTVPLQLVSKQKSPFLSFMLFAAAAMTHIRRISAVKYRRLHSLARKRADVRVRMYALLRYIHMSELGFLHI